MLRAPDPRFESYCPEDDPYYNEPADIFAVIATTPPDPLVEHPRGRWDSVPEKLRRLDRWVCWRSVPRGDNKDPAKVPLCPRDPSRNADPTDPGTWGTFDEAIRAVEATPGLSGIGFVFVPGDGLVGVDFDDVRDPSTGDVSPWALDWLRKLGGYHEASVSGTGVHAIVSASLPRGRRYQRPDGTAIEAYGEARYFTVSGRVLPTSGPILDAQLAVDELIRTEFPTLPEPGTSTASTGRLGLIAEDSALLSIARQSANGVVISDLYDLGKLDHHNGDHSQADLALVSHLAFYCGPDPDRIDQLFRKSNLMRDKWDERRGLFTYGQKTINRVLSTLGATYDPDYRSSSTVGAVDAKQREAEDAEIIARIEGWGVGIAVDAPDPRFFKARSSCPCCGARGVWVYNRATERKYYTCEQHHSLSWPDAAQLYNASANASDDDDDILDLVSFLDLAASEPDEFLVAEAVQPGGLTLLVAREKVGKTTMMTDLMTALAAGSSWMGEFDCLRCPTLYLDYENHRRYFGSALSRMLSARGVDAETVRGLVNIANRDYLRKNASPLRETYLIRKIDEIKRRTGHDRGVLVIDTALPAFMALHPESDWAYHAKPVREATEMIRHVATATGWGVVLLVHPTKSGSDAGGSLQWQAGADIILKAARNIDSPIGTISGCGRGITFWEREFTLQPSGLVKATALGTANREKTEEAKANIRDATYPELIRLVPIGEDNAISQNALIGRARDEVNIGKDLARELLDRAEESGAVVVFEGPRKSRMIYREAPSPDFHGGE